MIAWLLRRRRYLAFLWMPVAALLLRMAADRRAAQAANREGSAQIESKARNLFRQLGEEVDGARVRGERSISNHNGTAWWEVDGWLADGTEVFTFWNARTGRLRILSIRHSPSRPPFGRVDTKAQALALARGYFATVTAGRKGVRGRIDTVEKHLWTWTMLGRLWDPGHSKPGSVDIRIDRQTGLLTFLRLDQDPA